MSTVQCFIFCTRKAAQAFLYGSQTQQMSSGKTFSESARSCGGTPARLMCLCVLNTSILMCYITILTYLCHRACIAELLDCYFDISHMLCISSCPVLLHHDHCHHGTCDCTACFCHTTTATPHLRFASYVVLFVTASISMTAKLSLRRVCRSCTHVSLAGNQGSATFPCKPTYYSHVVE